MLQELAIQNFALLEAVRLSFGERLNVLTGETGAGKSILIDAIGAVLGDRVSTDVIRTGAERASVEAIFWLPAGHSARPALAALLREMGLDDGGTASAVEDDTIILARELNRSGRSIARINGRAVPASALAQVGEHLVDVHGQHEHLSLLRPAAQRDLLDRFGGLLPQRSAVAALVRELRSVRAEMAALQQDERETARRIDLLSYQIEDIQAARLAPGEEEALKQEQRLLANAARLAELAASIRAALVGGTGGDEESALDLLGRAARDLAQVAHIDAQMAPQEQTLADATALVEDLGRTIRAYQDTIDFAPGRFDEVAERLDLIQNLERKYGATIDDVIEFGRRAAAELDALANREAHTAALEARAATLEAELTAAAAALSRARAATAERLAGLVGDELRALGLRAHFEAALLQEDDAGGVQIDARRLRCDESGVDAVEFRFAPNPGEPARSVARTASGGELSRLLLALKAVLSAADHTPTLIFDEVDAGIGGRNGQVIGEKLAGLAPRHQVLCVTHLPQIAAYGDDHFFIAKQVRQGRTTTSVAALNAEGRVAEMAQMLGGETASTRAQAVELRAQAEAWKRRQGTEPGRADSVDGRPDGVDAAIAAVAVAPVVAVDPGRSRRLAHRQSGADDRRRRRQAARADRAG